MKITIRGVLPDLNQYINANRANRFAGAKIKKEATDLVAWQCKRYKKIDNPVVVTLHWFYSSKHDPDNIRFGVKYILDGLVKAGVLKDDTQRHVIGFGGDYFIKVSKGEEKVVVELEEYPVER